MRANTASSEIWLEILGKRAEAAGPPLDLIRRVNETFDVAQFELTTEPQN